MKSKNMSEKKGIVLNRMYTGSYLSSNLGHEVINMFPDDDGNHYMYLNATGDFSADHKGKIGTMLLIKYAGQDEDGRPWVEVLGYATGLEDIYNPELRIRQSEEDQVRSNAGRSKPMKDIKYGGVPIHNIFKGSAQQDVLISYYAEKLFVPQKDIRIFLRFAPFSNQSQPVIQFASSIEKNKNDSLEFKPNIENNNEATYIWKKVGEDVSRLYSSKLYVVEMETKFASTSLKRYYTYKEAKGKDADKIKKSNNDLKAIASLIAQKGLWIESPDSALINSGSSLSDDNNTKKKDVSIFDICRIENNENCFSNALAHFIDKYRAEWCKFFKGYNITLDDKFEIFREIDATIPKNNNDETENGGRIDLLIKDEKNIIVIENKIKSDINGVKGESEGKQLERYQKYAHWLKYQHELDEIKDELQKQYVNSNLFDVHKDIEDKVLITINSKGNKQPYLRDKKQVEVQGKEIWKSYIGKEIKVLEVHLFVLSPNYNIPHIPRSCGEWETITYEKISDFLEKDLPLSEDINLEDFFNVMQRHKCKNLCDWLRIDMRNKFIARIKFLK